MPADEHIEYLNARHAVVMIAGKCLVLNEERDPVFNRPDISFSSINDFKNRYSNRKIKFGKKEFSIASAWLDSCDRREYEGIVFAPGVEIDGYYNLFRGYAVEPQHGIWELMQQHILEIICDGNEEHYQWLLDWMARIVQRPGGVRPGTAIVLRGKRGVGKGIFVNNFGKIFGNHFLHLFSGSQLTGRFNQHLKDALLVFADESFFAGDKKSEGSLKGLITEDIFMIEPKNVNAFPVQNHVNLLMASNNDWVVPAGCQERRFFVLDVSDDHIQDHEYFGAIVDQMENGGVKAMLYDLMSRDFDLNNLRHAPRTQALLEQITFSMTTVQKFWLDRLNEGLEIDTISVEEMHNEYIKFSREVGERYKLSQSQLGKELRKVCPGLERRYRGSRYQRGYMYILPDLETCRREFQDAIGIRIPEWDEQPESEEENDVRDVDYDASNSEFSIDDLIAEDA